jgi:hypothetical protein
VDEKQSNNVRFVTWATEVLGCLGKVVRDKRSVEDYGGTLLSDSPKTGRVEISREETQNKKFSDGSWEGAEISNRAISDFGKVSITGY